MNSPRFLLLVAAVCAAVPPVLGAADAVPMRAERVALFKNGYSQVSLVGQLPAGKQLELKGLPVPVKGTLWWSLPEGVKALQVTGSISEREVPSVGFTQAELLAANVGKRVRLVMTGGQTYEGELTRQPLPEPAALTYTNHTGSAQQRELSQQAPVFLKTAQGELLDISMGTTLSISFAEPPATPMTKELQPQMTMELRKPAPGGELRMECLAGGLSWETTYRLDLAEGDKAELSCNAIIVNDMVDLQNAHLELITGQPELGSDGLPISPLTRLNQMNTMALNRKAKVSARYEAEPSPVFDDEADDDDAGSFGEVTRTQELYHYAIPDFCAKKNSTVSREIFVQEPGCHHFYTCRLGSGSLEEDQVTVWHCLRLKNEATWPWGRGTLVCYSGGRLLARMELKETAPGQETKLRLAVSQDVRASQRERLTESKPYRPALKAKPRGDENAEMEEEEDAFADHSSSRRKATQTLSTYSGEITLKNNAEHDVDLEITKQIYGRVTAAGEGGQADVTSTGRDNPSSRILWKLHLTPGEAKTCSYTYECVN